MQVLTLVQKSQTNQFQINLINEMLKAQFVGIGLFIIRVRVNVKSILLSSVATVDDKF